MHFGWASILHLLNRHLPWHVAYVVCDGNVPGPEYGWGWLTNLPAVGPPPMRLFLFGFYPINVLDKLLQVGGTRSFGRRNAVVLTLWDAAQSLQLSNLHRLLLSYLRGPLPCLEQGPCALMFQWRALHSQVYEGCHGTAMTLSTNG